MFKHVLSLRITDKAVYDWLSDKKTRELSINTIIMQALRRQMQEDKDADK